MDERSRLEGDRAQAPALRHDVFALGEISLDRVVPVETLPSPGAKVRLEAGEVRPGGQIATAALGCRRLGLSVAYAVAVGEDRAASIALDPLEREGVDLAAVQVVSAAATRQAIVLVERGSGERSVLERRDPAAVLQTGKLDRRVVEQARAVLIDTTDPEASLWAARVARTAGVPVVLDADQRSPGLDALLELVDFPVVSQSLAEEIGSSASVRAGLVSLARRGARTAVATLGPLGALARSGEREIASAAFEITPLDTTGAGDAFHAGFVAALLAGFDLEVGIRRANAVAAMSCRADGAQGGLPTAEEVEAFLREARQRRWRDPG